MKAETSTGRRAAVYVLLASAAFGLGFSAYKLRTWHLPAATGIPAELQGSLWPEPQPLSAFSLTDQHRQRFGRERLLGKWSFVFFGYTSCPDVCPTTLQSLERVKQRLANPQEPGGAPQFIFVTVDPQRDSIAQLARYVAYFDKDFIGLTGSDAEIAGFARQLQVMYQRSGDAQGNDYQISHTSAVMLIDPQGRLVAAFSRPHDTDAVVSQFHAIQHLYGG